MSQPTPVPRMLRGDEAEVYNAHRLALECAVRRAVNAPAACIEDACSFAWLQFLRLQPDRDTVFPWLRTVAIREAWRLSRRERRDGHLEDAPAWEERTATESLRRTTEAHHALESLAALPHRQRRYLTLLVSGHSYAEIARTTGATYTNVNKHLTRARASLRLVARTDH